MRTLFAAIAIGAFVAVVSASVGPSIADATGRTEAGLARYCSPGTAGTADAGCAAPLADAGCAIAVPVGSIWSADRNTVHQWDMGTEQLSTTDLWDSTTNAINGTGATAAITTGYNGLRARTMNGSVSFISNVITGFDGAARSGAPVDTALTVEEVVKIPSLVGMTAENAAVYGGTSGGTFLVYLLRVKSDGTIFAYVHRGSTNGANESSVTTSAVFPQAGWVHVRMAYDGPAGMLTVFANTPGATPTQVGQTTGIATTPTLDGSKLNQFQFHGPGGFGGTADVSAVRVSNTVRTGLFPSNL